MDWHRIHRIVQGQVYRNGCVVQYPDPWLTMDQVKVFSTELEARRFEDLIAIQVTHELVKGNRGVSVPPESRGRG